MSRFRRARRVPSSIATRVGRFCSAGVLLAATAAACTREVPDPPDTSAAAAEPTLPPAPWSERPITSSDLPPVYRAEWRKADNRSTCALVAPRSLREGEGATARAANFAGGWAVAYDRPGLRSAFGVAGTGSKAADPAYSDWPHVRRWADGSFAEYGPEGGTGPNRLAYLRIAGQECLYNVWSRLGREHLEELLDELRFVE